MKAQLSFEFLYAVVVVLIISLLISVAVGRQFEDMRRSKELFLVNELASGVRDEFFIATEAEDGYQRTFAIPHNISGANYNLSLINTSLVFQLENIEYVLRVPSSKGAIAKGANTIRKSGGVVYLN